MSNLKVVTLNGTTSTAGVSTLRIRRVERDLLGDRRDARVFVPGRDGSWVFPEEPGNRHIGIIGWLQAEGVVAKRAAIHSLAQWADTPNGEVKLVVDDESDRFYWVTLEDFHVDTAVRYAEVELDYVGSAYGQATAASTQTLSLSGTSPQSGSFSISDDVYAIPTVEVTPTNGTITGFTLAVGTDQLTRTGTIANGNTITISSISNTVTTGANTDTELTGAYNPALLSMVDVSGTFPLLQPGSNSWVFTWTGTATTITIRFTWRRRYR